MADFALPSPSPPAWLLRAALAARRALQSLADRVVPAEVVLLERSTGLGHTLLLGAAAKRRLADVLTAGPLSASEIARRLGTHPDATARMMRALAATGVFRRKPDGRYEHSRLSRAFRSGPARRSREWLEYFGSPTNVAAWADFEGTLVSGRSAFERVFGATVWEYLDAHPEERALFAQTVTGFSAAQAPVVAALYPFGELGRVCDVGGGLGTLLAELLLRHRHLTGALCERPSVLADARTLLTQRGVAHRVELVPGDFFERVPTGADAYVLKNILHDWDDERCGRVLEVCRGAMREGERLLVVEHLLEDDEPHGLAVLSDLQMMVVCSEGRERSGAQYTRLLRRHGFTPGRILRHPVISVLEGIAR